MVVGDRKMAVFDDTQHWEGKLLLHEHQIHWENNLPVPQKADAEQVTIEQDEPLKRECLHFLDCIANGQRPVTDGSEGLQVLKVLNVAQSSLNKGGRQLPFSASPDLKRRDSSVHDTAVVDDNAEIGGGTKIWHFSHILSGSKIGDNCNIGQNVVIGPEVPIGNNCKIQNNVSVFKGVTLEDGVFCGPSMVFTNIYNPRAEIRKMDQVRPTRVKHGATLGANCTIICGITIGRYAFVGAGAVVNQNVLDHALVVGNPFRQIGWACQCGERLPDDLECLVCDRTYEKSNEGLKEKIK